MDLGRSKWRQAGKGSKRPPKKGFENNLSNCGGTMEVSVRMSSHYSQKGLKADTWGEIKGSEPMPTLA